MRKPLKTYTSIEEILTDAIAEEQAAEEWYRSAADYTSEEELRCMLLQLSAMEADHARELQTALDRIQAQQSICRGIMISYGEEWCT
jgi:rubrerythrin